MIALILSISALYIGSAIYPATRTRPSFLSALDAFALVSIIGLAAFHLIPHSTENAGIPGIIAVAAGFGLPALMHLFHNHDARDHHDDKPHPALMLIAAAGILVHTFLDGIGLASGNMLGLGVLFHRLPVGVFLSLVLIPRIGYAKTIGIVSVFAVSTLAGFLLGGAVQPHLDTVILFSIQGLIAGALLHIVFHNMTSAGKHAKTWPAGIGAIAGFIALFLIELFADEHHHDHASILETWFDLLIKAAPLWCAFVIILGVCFRLAASNNKKTARLGHSIIEILDPQPLPAILGGSIHSFSATGFILLFTLFDLKTATLWLVLACATSVILKNTTTPMISCNECRRESFCSIDKSLTQWIASGFLTISLALLVASVIPEFFEPIADALGDCLDSSGSFLLWIPIPIVLGIAMIKRGLSLIGCILAMYSYHACFPDAVSSVISSTAVGILGLGLLWLYDCHFSDISLSSENSKWIPRYLLNTLLVLIVSSIILYLYACIFDLPNTSISEEHGSVSSIHPLQFLCFAVFCLNGLFWIVRCGPRSLFKMASGKSHHHHDEEATY